VRVILRLTRTAAVVGELDLLPSNLRRLTEVDYLGTRYEVVNQYTSVVKGEPVATLDLREVRP
jgi:hypothetical protein